MDRPRVGRHALQLRTTVSALFLFFAMAGAQADLGFPVSVKLPAQIHTDPDQNLIDEVLGEAEFPSDKAGKPVTRRGRHYQRWFAYQPAAGEPKLGYYNGSEERIFKAMQPLLLEAGWQSVFVAENKSAFTLRLNKGGKESWITVKMDAPQGQVNVELVEVGGASNPLVLKAPATTVETFSDQDDFPYLSPYPGSSRKDAAFADGPLALTELAKAGDEPKLVGTGVMARSYQGPSSLSRIQFVNDYSAALNSAGWKVLYPAPAAQGEAASLVAHYERGGRDLWVRLVYEYGANLSFSVADVGSEDWSAKLERDCRLPLYGVFFDFNKASLQAESASTLNKAAALLAKAAAIKVEVQGHTDNVGADDYNMKLSAARAATVSTWLAQHGVAAGRLTSRGYGKTEPVADNGSDAGRAKNRRVELRKLGCSASR